MRDLNRPLLPGLLALLLLTQLLAFASLARGAEEATEEGMNASYVVGPAAGPPLQGAELAARTQQVGKLIRCPVCQGLSVADSPTDSAVAMKEEVRSMLAEGYSQEQILSFFEASYGEFIRLQPKAEGFNWWVWLAPIAVVLIGLLLVAGRLRAPVAPAAKALEVSEVSDPDLQDYLQEVRREVAKR